MSTSGKALINKDTVINKQDIMGLPFTGNDDYKIELNDIENSIVHEINNYYYDFMTKRVNSKMLNSIKNKDFKDVLMNFGSEFCKVLNQVYQFGDKKFRLSNVDYLKVEEEINTSFIATVFKYDEENKNVEWSIDKLEFNLDPIANHEISTKLKSKRIIRIYNKKDTIVFIKPNQLRYWLSSIAYRDGDKSIVELTKAGY